MDYKTIGNALQIEGDIVHVKPDVLGIKSSHVVSREDGLKLFNDVAEQHGLHPIKDPRGYMILDDNIHSYLRDAYTDVYEDMYDKLENNMIIGSRPAVEYVLNNIQKTIRIDVKEFLPSDINYSELRFVKCTDEMKDIIDELAENRAKLTILSSVRRSVEESTIQDVISNIKQQSKALGDSLRPNKQIELEL